MALYPLQATFSKGEASPRLYSRADLEYFKAWLMVCRNWTVMRQGGIRRRAGTEFIGEVKDSHKPVRLIPFIFSAEQAYVLEVGDGYFRVYAAGGRVGTVDVSTPWPLATLFEIDYDQTNDVQDVTHRTVAPQRIRRLSDTNWTVGPVPLFDGPYLPINVTPTVLKPGATGNPIPVMTSNTTPSGVASASEEGVILTDTFPAYYAFDGVPSSPWLTNAGHSTGWLEYQFPASHVISGYSVQAATFYFAANSNGIVDAPKSWTFEAFDGSNWIILDTQYAQSEWSTGETRFFPIANATLYNGYRLNVASNNGGQELAIGGLAFQESADTAPEVSIAASSAIGLNSDIGFMPSDVGRSLTILGSDGIWHPFQITTWFSALLVNAKLIGAPLPRAVGSPQWRLGAWGSVEGWPSRVCTAFGRKAFARTDGQPNAVAMTRSGGFGAKLDFSVTVPTQDDDAIFFSLSDVNEIQWIAEGPSVMMMGSAGAARTLGRNSANLPFSAANFLQSLASSYGSEPLRPVKVGGSAIFASRFGKAIREFTRSDNGVDFVTPDISVLSEHLFAPGVVDAAYQQEPDSVVWWARRDGALVGLTYEKEQAMAGMHWHQMGGGGFVESVCTIPGPDRHELWMVVRRTIGGDVKRYIERMAAPFNEETDAPENAWCLDCALRYEGDPTTVISGLGHLEGLRVSILADGAREPDQIVRGGAVTLASGRAASKVLVGLSYSSRARTMPSNLAVGDGSGLGRKKKVVKTLIDILGTGSLKVGSTEANAEEIVFRATTDDLGEAVPLKSGVFNARPATSWSDDGEIEMIADGPFPAIVRSVTPVTEPGP